MHLPMNSGTAPAAARIAEARSRVAFSHYPRNGRLSICPMRRHSSNVNIAIDTTRHDKPKWLVEVLVPQFGWRSERRRTRTCSTTAFGARDRGYFGAV